MLGKVAPHDIDSEVAVLGACLMEKDTVEDVIQVLGDVEDLFYDPFHETVYRCILTLYKENAPIDIITVANKVKMAEGGDNGNATYRVADLTSNVMSTEHAIGHASIILSHYISRIAIKSNMLSTEKLYAHADPLEVVQREYQKLEYIMGLINKRQSKSLSTVIDTNIENTKYAMSLADHITGVDTGFDELNKMTAGWQKNNLIILAARPAMGKTALALAFAKAAADGGTSVLFFTLEMSEEQMVARLQASEAHISLEDMVSGRIGDHDLKQLEHKSEELKSMDSMLRIMTRPGATVMEIKALCNQHKKKHGLGLVVVDYLQLMSGEGKNRESQISNISMTLKAMAVDLDIPIIALSQLNRSVESRGGDKKPQLSDLRESGAIEQDADLVAFVHRPEYYGITEDSEGNSTSGVAEIIIAKNRQGRTDSVFMQFVAKFVKFIDIKKRYAPDYNSQLHEEYKSKSPDPEDAKDDDTDWLNKKS